MCYLIRMGEDDYRLFYSKPVWNYVVSHTGSYWDVNTYEKMLREEVVGEVVELLGDYVVHTGWADCSEDNCGLPISKTAAEYLLQGEYLGVDEYFELNINNRGDQND